MDTNRIGEWLAAIFFDANRCRKCWKKIKANKLWCKSCRACVDRELRWEDNQPFSFYFEFYQWREQKRAELWLNN